MEKEIEKMFKKILGDVKAVRIEDQREHPVFDYVWVFGTVVTGEDNIALPFKIPVKKAQ